MATKISIAAAVMLLIAGAYYWFDYRNKSAESKRLPGLNYGTDTKGADNSGNANTMEDQNADGLKIEVLQEGSGDGAKAGNTVTVHYTGTLADGRKFDSSHDREQPLSFPLGAGYVIRGWDQGLIGMKAGEKRRLIIPPELGYGARGSGNIIPPNATLIFEVEMLEIR